jgi:hypothetical protein
MCGKSYPSGSGNNAACDLAQGGTASGETVAFGEYSAGGGGCGCCGDDFGEYYRIEKNYSRAIAFDNDEEACCNAADNIGGTTCYTTYASNSLSGIISGLNAGGNDTIAYSYTTGWLDCDHADYMDYWCGTACGPGLGQKNPRDAGFLPNASWNAVYSGESINFGEYINQTALECCGDDNNENYRSGTATHNQPACCNAATDCVNYTNICVDTGTYYTNNSKIYICNAGAWTYNATPVIMSYLLNTTSLQNTTLDNLTITFTSTDANGDAISNFTDWRKGGISIALLNMPFNNNISSTATGAVKDYSTFGNNGTLGGGTASSAPTWTTSGKIGGAYSFGADEYIAYYDTANLVGLTTLTISAWVYPTSNTYIFQHGSSSVVNGYINYVRVTSAGVLGLDIQNSSGHVYPVTSSGIIAMNQWSFVTAVIDTDNVYLYVNGTLKTTYALPGGMYALASTTAAYKNIGRYYYSSINILNSSGTIDEVKVYNRTLSAAQVLQEYNAGLAGRSTNTIISNELVAGDVWTTLIGSCDVFSCSTNLSNSVTIVDAIGAACTNASSCTGGTICIDTDLTCGGAASCQNANSTYGGRCCSDDSTTWTAAGSGMIARNNGGTYSCTKAEVANVTSTYYIDCFGYFNDAITDSIIQCDNDVAPSYSKTGMCTYTTGTADATTVSCTTTACNNGTTYRNTCSNCYTTGSTATTCDSSTSDGTYGANGMCVFGGTCDAGNVSYDGTAYRASCDGYGGYQCDVATTGVYTQDGLCFDDTTAETEGTNHDCETTGYIYYNGSTYRDDVQNSTADYNYTLDNTGRSCDNSSDWTAGHNYTADGLVTTTGCNNGIIRVDASNKNYFVKTCDASGDMCD